MQWLSSVNQGPQPADWPAKRPSGPWGRGVAAASGAQRALPISLAAQVSAAIMCAMLGDDAALVLTLLSGRRPAGLARASTLPAQDFAGPLRQRRLYRALLEATTKEVEALLLSALTEPMWAQPGGDDETGPFETLPEASRTARALLGCGWPVAVAQQRLLGLRDLWVGLHRTAPDGWRVLDVAQTLCGWHAERRAAGVLFRAIQGAEALWEGDPVGAGADKLHHFHNFLNGLLHLA